MIKKTADDSISKCEKDSNELYIAILPLVDFLILSNESSNDFVNPERNLIFDEIFRNTLNILLTPFSSEVNPSIREHSLDKSFLNELTKLKYNIKGSWEDSEIKKSQ